MSYILEALRKAEQERRLGQVPQLAAVPALSAPARRSPWPWWLALIVSVNAAVVAALLHSRPEPAAPVAPPAAVKATVPEPVTKAAETPPAPPPPVARAAPPAQPKPAPPAAPVATPPSPLSALPADFRQSLPAMNIDIHVHSPLRRKRFVLINSRRYQEGERLREGPLLEAITRDGVVLNHRGTRFLLPIQR
ncbi:MAG: general secretion pathway protein GspB [Pseudomonadota bacterium]|nr:general secretion pathway protein GspB [Pseudomonadota bacterium]